MATTKASKSRLFVLALLGVLPITATPSQGQDPGAIMGVIVDEDSLLPIGGGEVVVVGRAEVARSTSDGIFATAAIPPGKVTFRLSAPGYLTLVEEVEVSEGETVYLQFALTKLSTVLEGILAYGRDGGSEGSALAENRGREHSRTAADLLAAQVPGLIVGSASGAVGSGSRVNIRGSNSLLGRSTPAIYVDGIRVSESQGNVSGPNRASISILNTIPASDVRRIRVFRGSSASALYGDSMNGVILIETVRGENR